MRGVPQAKDQMQHDRRSALCTVQEARAFVHCQQESADDLAKRRQGAKRAEEREMVRRAARRVIVFGLEVPRREPAVQKHSKSKGKVKRGGGSTDDEAETSTTEIRKAEALMSGMVVEPSFAKGNWSIRWRG